MPDYYRARAPEYDRIYDRSERQDDLAQLTRRLPELMAGREVLEVACGTGYWTRYLAQAARRVVATDLCPETIALARAKEPGPAPVAFRVADAFELGVDLGTFDGAFAGFWWSHVPREAVNDFLTSLHGRLEAGALVVVIDNLYVEGNSTAISRWDDHGNSYQTRTLREGTSYEVMKNFPVEDELRETLSGLTSRMSFMSLEYYWLLCYQVGA